MDKILRDAGLGLLTSFLATFGGCLAGGCATKLGDRVEYGFKQSTSWGFYHDTGRTGVLATAELSIPSLEEWIMGPPEPEATETD